MKTNNSYFLSLREREAFTQNVREAMREQNVTIAELADKVNMPRSTCGNKLSGHNAVRYYEAYLIADVLGLDREQLFMMTNEEDDMEDERMPHLVNVLSEREEELRERLIDMALSLAKKESPSATEVSALAALVNAITDMK